jgi:hypothetical protein
MHVKTVVVVGALVGCGGGGRSPDPWGVPITGGTLLVTRDGSHAVVADPDRDRILSVDLVAEQVTSEVTLTAGDEPGRLIEDGAGRIHVALRRGGAVLTLTDAVNGQVAERRHACGEPRGLAWDAATDRIHVACATGELVSFAAGGGDAVRTLQLDRDLRDVIVQGANLVVTRFRSAEVLTLDAQGTVIERVFPPMLMRFGGFDAESDSGINSIPTVAWRTIALPDGRVVLSHQRAKEQVLGTQQEGGYGGDCGSGPVESSITVIASGAAPFAAQPFTRDALPVDLAVSPGGGLLAVVAAGSKQVVTVPADQLTLPDQDHCPPPNPSPPDPDDDDDDDDDDELGRPTSVAFRTDSELVIFYPELPGLVIRTQGNSTGRTIKLTGTRGHDAGRSVFHAQTRISLSCASCHPEGREDGRAWNFAEFGVRRTQSLAGHILERAPYHWTGDMASLPILMDDVFAVRMAGGALSERQKSALGPWLDRIPAPAPRVGDPPAIERGRALFESSALGCVSCHNGDLQSNLQLVNVGTDGTFKVPSLLGIGARAPFMHDGCATTLLDRFTTCGGGDAHGMTSQLDAQKLSDLVAYLESL